MKLNPITVTLVVLFIGTFMFSSLTAFSQDKPKVFVEGHGTTNVHGESGGGGLFGGSGLWGGSTVNATTDSHNESMEMFKDLAGNCPQVALTMSQVAADYSVLLNRESKAKTGVFIKNSQLLVANKAGNVISTGRARSVSNASKDACAAILADWQNHGRTPPVSPTPMSDPAAITTEPTIAPVQQNAAALIVASMPVSPVVVTTQVPVPAIPSAVHISGMLGISGANWEESGLKGVEILGIAPDSTAEMAGLHVGNVITDADGRKIRSTQDLANFLAQNGPGSKISLGYMFKSNLGWMGKEAVVVLTK